MAGQHTKRSPDFSRELSRLTEKLRANTLDSDERSRLLEILDKNTTDSSCIVKAGTDEPIFVLRGQDELASDCVVEWARAFAQHRELRGGELPPDSEEKYRDALECAGEMAGYRIRRMPN